MKLSIIIVNYNVRYFLEQCLHSVLVAAKGIDHEIFVVDNASVDDSCSMVREKFPTVKLIASEANLGFSKANNLAIRESHGEYVLLLNPDTLVEQDTFSKTLAFMDEHPDAGGLGVRMIDGKGHFLPESKRGLPTPEVAFYKIFGLAKLFPRSKTFGRYHLGFLSQDEVHKVDVLSGAFMLMRREALDKTGLLDEEFFMYGEDIDLSYRLIKAGYANYYFPGTSIIHYKGESTRKSSINYVFVFYNAMIIFARKHFSQRNARAFSMLIHMAIYLRATMAIVSRALGSLFLPLADAAGIFGGIYLLKKLWVAYLFGPGTDYPAEFLFYQVPAYIFTWLFTLWVTGGYDKPINIPRIVRGLSLGTLIILVLYSLLPESLRFSRALILLSFVWTLIFTTGLRAFLHHVLHLRTFRLDSALNRRILIAGEREEANRVAAMVRNTLANPGFIGLISTSGENSKVDGFIGDIRQLHEIIEIYRIDELIFCAKDIPAATIIGKMSELQDLRVDLKIAPPESLSIIGSKNISTPGDLYIVDIDSITRLDNRRKKTLLDLFLSLFSLASLPLWWVISLRPAGFTRNLFLVLFLRSSWVGYRNGNRKSGIQLPGIKKGILSPIDAYPGKQLDDETIEKLNLLYARDYKLSNDLYIIWKGMRKLGK